MNQFNNEGQQSEESDNSAEEDKQLIPKSREDSIVIHDQN